MKKNNCFLGQNIYFVGICGISMSSLAKIVYSLGANISGSDISTGKIRDDLEKLGIKVNSSHKSANVTRNIDLLVYTSAIKEDNQELVTARNLGIKIMERAEFLGIVSQMHEFTIAVAGTHGKTTTTAMIADILSLAGKKFTLHIGGVKNSQGYNNIQDNKIFLTEACEYCNNFRYLRPDIAVVTNIELDHTDFYKSMDDLTSAFDNFKTNSKYVVSDSWQAKHVEYMYGGYTFNVYDGKEFYGTFRINVLGRHNVENAVRAIAVADRLDIDKDVISKALVDFVGVERRYERIFTYSSGCRVIIDYAHHPSEIETSIQGIKEAYKKILVVFQPHTYSRTLSLLDNFIKVLNVCNNVIIYKTYPAREKLILGGTAMDIYSRLSSKQKNYIETVAELRKELDEKHCNFDCILVLGAGNLGESLKSEYNNV